MAGIIVATEEQIEELLDTIEREVETLNLSSALKVLDEHGFPTSKAKLYKMTSLGQIPFMKYGNKLVFSRKSLVEWAHEQLVSGSTDKV